MRPLMLFIGLSIAALAACSRDAEAGGVPPGDTTPGQRSFDLAGFTSVSLGGYQNVVVRVGPAASVRAEGPQNELALLDIDVDDGDLRIRTKRGSWDFPRDRQPVTVHVTLPRLTAASIGGSGDMRIDRVDADSFSASIGGSGDIDIGALKARDASFSIAGSGNIRAVGATDTQTVSIAGAGDMELGGLASRVAQISILGSGDVSARATESAQVNIMGSGDVDLSGGAKCAVRKVGSGEVRCTG